MIVRTHAIVTVRTPVVERSGTLDNGNPWHVREFEGVDEDANKAVFRVRDGITVETGRTYDLVCDVEADRRLKSSFIVVAASPVAAAASK